MIDEAYSEYAALSYEAAVGVVDPVERLRVGALGALRVATARTEPFTAQLARSTVAPGRPRARHETRVLGNRGRVARCRPTEMDDSVLLCRRGVGSERHGSRVTIL